jgi:hypothetical protein
LQYPQPSDTHIVCLTVRACGSSAGTAWISSWRARGRQHECAPCVLHDRFVLAAVINEEIDTLTVLCCVSTLSGHNGVPTGTVANHKVAETETCVYAPMYLRP